MIENGKTITVHYTGKHENGEVFDTSIDKSPLKFTVGSKQLIDGFENAVLGKDVGDKITVELKPEEAYGVYNEELIINVPNSKLPGPVEIGMSLHAQSDNGQPITVFVKEINEDHILVDANHPFAGKTLIFDIEILSVE